MVNEMWKKTAFITAGIGSLNWGLNHVLNFNLVEKIFSTWPWAVWLVYVFIAVAGGFTVYYGFKE